MGTREVRPMSARIRLALPPEVVVRWEQIIASLVEAGRLDQRHVDVLRARLGLDGGIVASIYELAQRHNVSTQRISLMMRSLAARLEKHVGDYAWMRAWGVGLYGYISSLRTAKKRLARYWKNRVASGSPPSWYEMHAYMRYLPPLSFPDDTADPEELLRRIFFCYGRRFSYNGRLLCTSCHVVQPEENFYRLAGRFLTGFCKSCNSERARRYRMLRQMREGEEV